MSYDALRRGAQQVVDQTKGRSGGKKGGFWLKWKPPVLPKGSPRPVAEPVIFVKREYADAFDDQNPGFKKPFHHYRKHNFRKGPKDFKDSVCSAGPNAHAPQPCIGCYEVDHGAKGGEARDYVAFELLHLVVYHRIPYVKDGKVQYKQDKPQEMITILEECEQSAINRNCQYCAAGDQQAPRTFGTQRVLELGTGHLAAVLQMDSIIGNTCANCATSIATTGYDCEKCGTELLSLATAGYNDQQLQAFAQNAVRCPNQQCGHTGLPQEAIDCGYDPQGFNKLQGRGCPDNVAPRRLSLFEEVVYLQREGESKDTKLVMVGHLPHHQFPTPDGRPLQAHLEELAKTPIDLTKMFAPDDLASQAQRLNVPNHFASQQGSPLQQYGQAPVYGQPQQPQPGYGPPPGQAPQQYGQPQQPPPGQAWGPPAQQPQQPQQQWGQQQPPPQQPQQQQWGAPQGAPPGSWAPQQQGNGQPPQQPSNGRPPWAK